MAKFGRFESTSGVYWSPSYGDIDWAGRRARMIEDDEVEAFRPVGFDSEDGLVQEVNQENTGIYLSQVAPELDMIAHLDTRDGEPYLWFREENPERFEVLVKSLGRAATQIATEYPVQAVVKAYLDRRSTGLDTKFLNDSEDEEEDDDDTCA